MAICIGERILTRILLTAKNGFDIALICKLCLAQLLHIFSSSSAAGNSNNRAIKSIQSKAVFLQLRTNLSGSQDMPRSA